MNQDDAYRAGAAKHFGVPYNQVTAAQRQEYKERTFLARYCASPAEIDRIIARKRVGR